MSKKKSASQIGKLVDAQAKGKSKAARKVTKDARDTPVAELDARMTKQASRFGVEID